MGKKDGRHLLLSIALPPFTMHSLFPSQWDMGSQGQEANGCVVKKSSKLVSFLSFFLCDRIKGATSFIAKRNLQTAFERGNCRGT